MLTDSTENTVQNSDLVWRKLTLSVNHSPQDLKLLTQRILFCLDNNLSGFAAGALQDLFILLKDNGVDLRIRMLNLIRPLLDYSERKYFQQKIIAESDSFLRSPKEPSLQEGQHFAGSVLAASDYQLNEFSLLPKASEFQDKQQEAQYLIACGKLFLARELLETSYLNDRADSLLESELQYFYFYAKDKKGLEHFMIKLPQNNNDTSNSWQTLRKASMTW